MPVAVASLTDGHLPGRMVIVGTLLIVAATVLGAWLARRGPGRHEAWLGAAGGALLGIAGLHLLPDAWSAARAAHSPGFRRAAPDPGPRPSSPDAPRHRRATRARRGNDQARSFPRRAAGFPG